MDAQVVRAGGGVVAHVTGIPNTLEIVKKKQYLTITIYTYKKINNKRNIYGKNAKLGGKLDSN